MASEIGEMFQWRWEMTKADARKTRKILSDPSLFLSVHYTIEAAKRLGPGALAAERRTSSVYLPSSCLLGQAVGG